MTWNRRTLLVLVAAATVTAAVTAWRLHSGGRDDAAEVGSFPEPARQLFTEAVHIRRGDTLDTLLEHAGVDTSTKVEMIDAVTGAFDVKKLRAGTELTLVRLATGTLAAVEYIVDPDHRLAVSRSEGKFNATIVEIPGTVRTVPVRGTLDGSLFESIERTGERAELAIEMSEIFAWDLDFYRDPRQGDQFCLLVEKKEYDNGQPPTYRRILAAEYINAGTRYDAFLYDGQEGPHYYSSDGRSLQSAFLRSPLAFDARVSSRFSAHRFHPVLKVYRPHYGTDYAAPTGTPVRTVASGKVVFSGRSGGSGNMVTVRHANGFETMYLHLSRRLVRAGQQVQQGQSVGLVGMTGLATGPHLDFRVRKNGKYIDFQHMRVPRVSAIAAAHKQEFNALRDRLLSQMTGSSPGSLVLASHPSPAAGGPSD